MLNHNSFSFSQFQWEKYHFMLLENGSVILSMCPPLVTPPFSYTVLYLCRLLALCHDFTAKGISSFFYCSWRVWWPTPIYSTTPPGSSLHFNLSVCEMAVSSSEKRCRCCWPLSSNQLPQGIWAPHLGLGHSPEDKVASAHRQQAPGKGASLAAHPGPRPSIPCTAGSEANARDIGQAEEHRWREQKGLTQGTGLQQQTNLWKAGEWEEAPDSLS
jgi:hypothetical protein